MEDLGLDPIVQESQEFEIGEVPEDDDSDVTPVYSYQDPGGSNSRIITSLTNYEGDVVQGVSMILRGCAATFRNSWFVDDAIGIGYNDSNSIEGGSGGISVNLGLGAATYWSIADPSDPQDVL